jgi:hypothetical protein
MNEKESLNLLDFLAAGINKQDPCIKAVLSDEDGEGAAANEVEEVSRFIDYYIRTDDVRNHQGKTLEMITKLFSKLRRRVTETDEVLLRRFLALTERKHDDIWGNALNLKHVFETYFKEIVCYIAENTNEESILENGDFEADDAWALEGGAAYSYNARFSGKRGLYFDGGADETCVQQLERLIPAGIYTFHFFLHGKCGVIIKREDGKYWNANDQVFKGDVVLEWVDDEAINVFEKPDGWEDAYCCVKVPADIHKITIAFVSLGGETAYIDYARLFVKPLNPSYTLVFQYEGYSITDKSLHLGAIGEDPVQGTGYEDESYFDRAFIVGPTGISQSRAFKQVLDIVRPCGIQPFAEFVEKNIVEEAI